MSSAPDAPRVPHAPRGPRRWSRSHGDAVRLRDVRPSGETVLAAAIALGALIVVRFLVAFVQLLGNAVDFQPSYYSSGFVASPIGLFLSAVVLTPLPFYLGAFLAAVFAFPFVRSVPLGTVLLRAVVGGAAGTVFLAVAGLASALPESTDATTVVLDAFFIPLSTGIELTAVLAGGAALAWLFGTRTGEGGPQDPPAVVEPAALASDEPAEAPAAPVADPAVPAGPASTGEAAAPVDLADPVDLSRFEPPRAP